MQSLENELDSWKKILEDLRQHNALLKYRLSEIVDDNEDKNFLLLFEYFQNELLLKDETLKKLMKDVQELNGINEPKNAVLDNMNEKFVKLHEEIQQFQKKYTLFSRDFNKKMPANTNF